MKRLFFIYLLLFFGVLGSEANEFRYIQPTDGLLTAEINDIAQDSTGRMWFATCSGLISYDGFQYRNYRPVLGSNKSIPEKYVKQLFLDSEGQLWIITLNHVTRLNIRNLLFDTFRFDVLNNDSIDIFGITEVSKNIIINTSNGFYTFSISDSENTDYLLKPIVINVNYESGYQQINHFVWVNYDTFIGISKSNINDSNNIYRFHFDDEQKQLDTQLLATTSLKISNAALSKNPHELLFASHNGVITYNYVQNTFHHQILFEGESISHVIEAINDVVYAVNDRNELLYFDNLLNQSGVINPISNNTGHILPSPIKAMFQDFSGVLWLGHKSTGITLINLFHKDFITVGELTTLPKSRNDQAVTAIESNSDFLITGTRTGLINIISIKDLMNEYFQFTTLEIFKDNDLDLTVINDIERHNDSLFWIATDRGLYTLHLSNANWELKPFLYRGQQVNQAIYSLYVDGDKNLWCGTWQNGLLYFDEPLSKNNQGIIRVDSQFSGDFTFHYNIINHITRDSKGNIWISTDNGVSVIQNESLKLFAINNISHNLEVEHFISHDLNDSLLNCNDINMTYECSQGKIWIATLGGGLNIYDPVTHTFDYITRLHGLPGNDIFGIIEDQENNFWISTDRGIAHIEQQGNFKTIASYDGSDGLQSDVFLKNSFHITREGLLSFGGENGFSSFYPQNILHNEIPPKILITDFRVSNENNALNTEQQTTSHYQYLLNSVGEISLTYQNNTFSIGIASVHYQNPDGNKIAYKLEGFHDAWHVITARARYVHFSKLPPGEYTFKAYAISTDNIPSEVIRTLSIKIQPPWYRSRLMTIALLIGGLFFITFTILMIFNRQRQIYLRDLYNVTLENNNSKMMFLANIAHDLRTPISLIISPIEDMLLNHGEIESKWHNHLQLIRRNSNYILKLINQIIDFKKLDAGNLKLNLKQVNLNDLVEGVVSNFKGIEQKNNVSLNLDLPHEPEIAMVDPHKLEEILYNLLSNAFKYTPKGMEIKVSVQIIKHQFPQSTHSRYVQITVFNQGSYIPEADREKIFERFYKINHDDDGAGIGLSFAKSLVELHQGKIWVNSKKGYGVSFIVMLPVHSLENSSSIQDNQLEEDLKAGISTGEIISQDNLTVEKNESAGKILIVEDNDDLRNFMYEILSRHYECFEANNGDDGLLLAKDIIPDLIITDAIMPKLDGFSMVRNLKSDPKASHIPIIMITALNETEYIKKGYETGVDSYVIKPINTNILLTQIFGLLQNRRLIHEKYKSQNFMVEVTTKQTTRDDVFLRKVKAVVEKNIQDTSFNVKEFSDEMQMSTTQLYRKIKTLTGHSPVEFLRITRLHKAHDLLIEKNYSIKEVAYLTGFNNLSYFVKCFREYFGMTPANHRDKTWPTG